MTGRRPFCAALATAVVLAGLAAGPGCGGSSPAAADKGKGKGKDGPPEVLVSRPTNREISDYEDFTGRTDAKFSVEVRARVTGYLDKVMFEDGAEVEAGAPLFEIDPRPYLAAYERAKANFDQAEARQLRAEADFRRINTLYGRGTASREEFDAIKDTFVEARAAVGVAQADSDLAELNLSFTKVSAPIAGRLSRGMVDAGNLVQADMTPLTSIVSLDPIYVYFDIDERTVLRIRRLIREGKIKSRTEAEVPVNVALADEDDFPHAGTINFSDNRVDPNTGTLRVRGVIPNPVPRILSPGMFVRVRLRIGTPHEAILIAERAIGTDQGQRFLFVVGDDGIVEERRVKVGTLNEDGLRVIEEGLMEGEQVVVNGVQRIRRGKKDQKVIAKPVDEDTTASASAPIPATEAAAGRPIVTGGDRPGG